MDKSPQQAATRPPKEVIYHQCHRLRTVSSKIVNPWELKQKGKRKVQGVPQSQTAALPRHQEEEETDKSKQAQIEQAYEKH